MKKSKKLKHIIIIVFLVIFNIIMSNIMVLKTNAYADNSSEIVIELNSNRILHEKNAYSKKFMASTTKILTAITVIENCDVNEIVTVTNKTVGIEGSSIYLEVGEKLSVKDLLYGLMLRSGNDCAETLAVHVSKNIENFAVLMNNLANKIGAKNSNFVNPHGLHDENHYTTAYDLALISAYAMKNPLFREIVGTKKIKIPHTTREYDRILINKNKMLTEFEGSTGIKTGYTKKAGRCLVSSVKRNGMELICVVLNCPPMFERSKTLFTECYNEYNLYKIVESDEIIGFIPIKDSNKTCPIIIKDDIYLPLTKNEFDEIRISYNLPTQISNYVESNTEIGDIQIFAQNNLIFNEKIYTIVDIKN